MNSSNNQRHLPCRLDTLFEQLMESIGEKEDFFFIQVGAHDGVSFDPINKFINKHNWSGILIEPLPHYFKLLKKTYKNSDNLIFEQVAASSSSADSMDFYYLEKNINSEKELEDWVFGCASFDKEVAYQKNSVNPEQKFAKQCSVATTTVSNLVLKHNVSQIDLLQIDAEGHDFEVIKGVDYSKVCPKIIHYECNKLGAYRSACLDFLSNNGYRSYIPTEKPFGDLLAIHKDSEYLSISETILDKFQ
jgi:FkbM family methyltransferase